jgi:arylsulfatase A
LPAFKGKQSTSRKTLISHSIGGSFSMRQGDWKLCLSGGSGGWSAPREGDAKKRKLPPMQLFNLKDDRGERKNLLSEKQSKANELIHLLNGEVERGRSSPGNPVSNDRKVTFLPAGVEMPKGK